MLSIENKQKRNVSASLEFKQGNFKITNIRTRSFPYWTTSNTFEICYGIKLQSHYGVAFCCGPLAFVPSLSKTVPYGRVCFALWVVSRRAKKSYANKSHPLRTRLSVKDTVRSVPIMLFVKAMQVSAWHFVSERFGSCIRCRNPKRVPVPSPHEDTPHKQTTCSLIDGAKIWNRPQGALGLQNQVFCSSLLQRIN